MWNLITNYNTPHVVRNDVSLRIRHDMNYFDMLYTYNDRFGFDMTWPNLIWLVFYWFLF